MVRKPLLGLIAVLLVLLHELRVDHLQPVGRSEPVLERVDRRVELEHERERVGGAGLDDRRDHVRRAGIDLAPALDREPRRLGVERRPIGELDVGPQLEGPRLAVLGDLIALRQRGLDLGRVVHVPQQPVVAGGGDQKPLVAVEDVRVERSRVEAQRRRQRGVAADGRVARVLVVTAHASAERDRRGQRRDDSQRGTPLPQPSLPIIPVLHAAPPSSLMWIALGALWIQPYPAGPSDRRGRESAPPIPRRPGTPRPGCVPRAPGARASRRSAASPSRARTAATIRS